MTIRNAATDRYDDAFYDDNDGEHFDEVRACTMLAECLTESDCNEGRPAPVEVRSFADAGVMTHNQGLVVRMSDGSEFQITVVRSK